MKDGKQSDVVMDFAKAFDTVSHTRLLQNLQMYRIYFYRNPNMFNCLRHKGLRRAQLNYLDDGSRSVLLRSPIPNKFRKSFLFYPAGTEIFTFYFVPDEFSVMQSHMIQVYLYDFNQPYNYYYHKVQCKLYTCHLLI